MGRAVTERLVAEGVAGLALTDISGRRLEAAVAALPPDLPVAAHRADITDAEEAAGFTTEALQQLGHATNVASMTALVDPSGTDS